MVTQISQGEFFDLCQETKWTVFHIHGFHLEICTNDMGQKSYVLFQYINELHQNFFQIDKETFIDLMTLVYVEEDESEALIYMIQLAAEGSE